jgi:hypothetical protein
MKPDFVFPQTPYDVFQERHARQREVFEEQSGVAYRYKGFDPAQFCAFSETEDKKFWECANCKRKIKTASTFGNVPIVMCLNPDKSAAQNPEMVAPVRMSPPELGGVVERSPWAAPKYGVGFELKKVLLKLQIELPPACVCNSRAMLLNERQIEEIEEMRPQIMAWFEDEAHKRAIYFDQAKANKILDIAIRRGRKAKAKYEAKVAQEQNGNG